MELVKGKIDGRFGHREEYEKLSYRFEHDYDYWPRGRVVFDIVKKTSIVYLDRCIKDDQSARKAIIEAFSLIPEKTLWKRDAHYKCHVCNPHYVDIPVDDFD